jgi:hypothetical protein
MAEILSNLESQEVVTALYVLGQQASSIMEAFDKELTMSMVMEK